MGFFGGGGDVVYWAPSSSVCTHLRGGKSPESPLGDRHSGPGPRSALNRDPLALNALLPQMTGLASPTMTQPSWVIDLLGKPPL